MKDYKILLSEQSSELEKKINAYAAKGWHVRFFICNQDNKYALMVRDIKLRNME